MINKKLILVSNDDGYNAPGLISLIKVASEFAHVVVVAPEQNQSGASNALTLNRPLFVRHSTHTIYYVNGTPADCVHIAITSGLLPKEPDLVLSGINNGANLGSDVLYSGTVAAATEAHLYGIPALAFSLAEKGWEYLATAERVVRHFLDYFMHNPLPSRSLLNINIPGVLYEQLNGYSLAKLGTRSLAKPAVHALTPTNESVYWIGGVGEPLVNVENTDFSMIAKGIVSITPLNFDLTDYAMLAALAGWANHLCEKQT